VTTVLKDTEGKFIVPVVHHVLHQIGTAAGRYRPEKIGGLETNVVRETISEVASFGPFKDVCLISQHTAKPRVRS
jgi:hypothetical protein